MDAMSRSIGVPLSGMTGGRSLVLRSSGARGGDYPGADVMTMMPPPIGIRVMERLHSMDIGAYIVTHPSTGNFKILRVH